MFTTGVSSSNEQEVDFLLGEKNPSAEDLLGGKKPTEEKQEDGLINTDSTKEKVDELDLLLSSNDTEGSKEVLPDSTKKLPTSKTIQPKKEESKVEYEPDYQVLYQKMVEDGVWEEVDVPEGVEWNKDTYLEISKLQAASQYEDLLSKTGVYGKTIIEFEKNGGNPSEMLNLFREQKDVRDYDISTEEGQEEFLQSFYNAQGYSEKSITRTIAALKDQGSDALKEESEEKKSLWDKQYEDEIKVRQQEQALYAKEVEKAQKQFNSNISETVVKDGDLTPKERKDLQSYILDYSKQFKGNQVSQFYLDMTEIQKDPKNYIELAKFVKGIKDGSYTKKVVDLTKKIEAAKSFIKIKNGNALVSSSSSPDLQSGQGSSNFISLLRK